MPKHPDISWIQTGVVAGLCASALYPLLIFVELPLGATAAAAAFLGPAIGVGSLGLSKLIQVRGPSVPATLGALSNFVAGSLFTAMVLVQLAARYYVPNAQPDGHIIGVWLGLDVAWDAYIGLGTIFFAWAMFSHPRFRWPFALPGLALGILVLVLNLLTFPTPPAEAGSVDVGPFIGLWYLASSVQAWRSIAWARHELTRLPGDIGADVTA